MKPKFLLAALVASTALVAMPAHAQAISADEAAAMRAQIEALRAQVAAMEARLNAAVPQATAPVPAPAPAPTPAPAPSAPVVETAWRGAPEFTSSNGWSFKPRGRIHYDVGNVDAPSGITATTRNLGTVSRVRRIRLGGEGTVPGGFGYKVEVDFANGDVSFADAFLSYDFAENSQLRIGNFESLTGLEQISSSNYVTYLERAAFNDGFSNTRRLGATLGWHNDSNVLRVEAGLFAAHSIDGSFDNDGSIAAARVTFEPEALGGRLHLGASVQRRDFASNANGAPTAGVNAPSTGQLARYRARPNSTLTGIRFVDTGSFAASGDTIIGLEAAGSLPGLYFAAEAQWLRARGYAAGDTATGLDGFGGTNMAVVPVGNPSFFGGYAEIGYFLTGETRTLRAGVWGRTRVRNPLNRGGSGAFQLAARLDHLDLNDSGLQAGPTNDFTTGANSLAALNTRLGRGGSQTSLLFGLNWYPVDYVRFLFNYSHVMVEGGPFAALADPLSTDPVNQRGYDVNVVAARMQVDF